VKAIAGVLTLTLLAGCRVAKRDAAASGEAARTDSTATPLSVRYDHHLLADGKLPPGATLTNPYAGQATSATEGAKLFNSMNCDGCHGGGATGWVGPSLSDGRWIYGGSDAAVFQSIYYGRPHGMPAFGGTLQPPIVWKLVTYLRSLPAPKSVPTQSW
jgi:mono/diheme cytochrome c family protein